MFLQFESGWKALVAGSYETTYTIYSMYSYNSFLMCCADNAKTATKTQFAVMILNRTIGGLYVRLSAAIY